MPVTKQAIKKVRQDKRKAVINLHVKKNYKEAVKKLRKTPTVTNLTQAYKQLDRAAKTNVIHKNKAARLKSRLTKLLPKSTKITQKKTQPASKKAKG